MRKSEIDAFFRALDGEATAVQKVSFPQLDGAVAPVKVKNSIRYLDDVKLTLSVELGSKTVKAGDLLRFGEGSVIELEKAVGEAVNIYVNDQRVARGEILVHDDAFAVRIHGVYAPRVFNAGGPKR